MKKLFAILLLIAVAFAIDNSQINCERLYLIEENNNSSDKMALEKTFLTREEDIKFCLDFLLRGTAYVGKFNQETDCQYSSYYPGGADEAVTCQIHPSCTGRGGETWKIWLKNGQCYRTQNY